MLSRDRTVAALLLFVLTGAFWGCAARDIPRAAQPKGELCTAQGLPEKPQARIGIYLKDDVKPYAYERRLLGVTFRMHVGEAFFSIWKQMASAGALRNAVFVTSLPPYDGDYRPDVQTVVEPDLLYAYGDVSGTVSGHVDARIRIRMTVYDLTGRTIWKDEAAGASRKEGLAIAGNYLGILEKADQAGHDATFSAAAKLMESLERFFRERTSSSAEEEETCAIKSAGGVTDLDVFRQSYKAAELLYKQRKFHQALNCFKSAERANPGDLATIFYLGACSAYTGDKEEALRNFRIFRELSQSGQEVSDATKWIEILEQPLKIGVAGPPRTLQGSTTALLVQKTLAVSRMYEVTGLPEIPDTAEETKLDRFLDECLKKGIRIVILDEVGYDVRKAVKERLDGADIATEYGIVVSAKVYSTRKKEMTNDFRIEESQSTMRQKTHEEEAVIRDRLLVRASRALVLRLLENDIF